VSGMLDLEEKIEGVSFEVSGDSRMKNVVARVLWLWRVVG
jgi:hypothetical protein